MHCQGISGGLLPVVMEPLEDRRLCSAGVARVAAPRGGDEVGTVVVAGKGREVVESVVVIPNASRFEGELVVVASSRPLVIDGLGAGTLAPGSSRVARLRITGRSIEGRLTGTLSIDGLGLAGTLGAFNVAGRIKGQRVVLNLADNGTGVARFDAKISKNGRVIAGKFTSKVNGDITVGQLRLVFTRPSALQTILGFRPIDTGLVIGLRSRL